MLLACRMLGLPAGDYLAAGHPWQRRILGHVADFLRLPPEEIGLAVDGCGVPTYHVPLAAAARGYAALAHPEAAGLAGETAAAVGTIVRSMTGAPGMVAGPGRFTTRLMEATGGRVLAKEGAEGFYSLAVRGPVALGIAIKIADGGERCRDGVVLDVLRQLGSLAGAEFAELRDLHTPALHNHRGLRVGEIRPEVDLEEV
jgi:L-asparaginase II